MNKNVGLRYCRTEMYAGRVACCTLMNHGERRRYRQTSGQTDGRQTVTLRFPPDTANITRDGWVLYFYSKF